jgi:hypothetical protein
MSSEKAKTAAVHFALAMAKRPRFADGGVVGPLSGTAGGRSDTLPISVPAGAFVVPADVVSGMPGAEGNSLAGHAALGHLFGQSPYAPDAAPYGASASNLKMGHTIPGQVHAERELMHAGMAAPPGHAAGGGLSGAEAKPVDIMAAAGEHVISPDAVRALGHGNLRLGHEILDDWVTEVRKRNIKDLQKLPGTVKT